MRRIYLDYAATTLTHSDVLKAMPPYFTDAFGNPLSIYSYARRQKELLKKLELRLLLSLVLGMRKSSLSAEEWRQITLP